MASLTQSFHVAPFIISNKSSFSLSNIPQSQPSDYLKISSRPTTLPLSLTTGIRKFQAINNNIKVGKNSQKLDGDHHHKWRIWGVDDGSCGVAPWPPLPPSVIELIQDFHKAVNAKDLHRLDQLLSDECQFQDLIFYETFQGKQGVIRFISSLMDAMGPNIRMVIESVIEGEDFTACAIWHLEWKKKVIPYTTGCRFFECEENKGKLYIRKITGVEELPLKPGDLVLKLLKAVSTLFDLYPVLAEGLLQGLKSQSTHEGIDMLLDILRKRHSST